MLTHGCTAWITLQLPMTASFVILICIDTGRLPGEPWAMVSDACWLLVFAARFWIM